jgi:ABC-type transport system involved in multi-copper enzyme maturation permease subunit
LKVVAILLDTCRELLYRKTLWIYSGLVTLTLLFFLLALQTDVAGGVIASLRVFGLEGHASGGGFALNSEQGGGPSGLTAVSFVRGIQIAVAFVLYPLGIMLSVFATAGLVPSMLEKGLIDLLLSKPVSRPVLFLSRYLGALLVAAANLVYLVGGLGLILGIKTGIWNPGFLLSGLAMALYFACLLGFVALCGVLFRSSTVAIMVTAVIFVVSLIVRWPHQNADWPRLITGHAARFLAQGLVETLYHALPRTYDFGQIVAALILDSGTVSPGPALGSALSGAAALAVATYYFSRTDF